jgi:glycosyltransferase involved in cell wall biosynthesis
MKIAIVVPGGLHPGGRHQVVPSWLELFERLAKSHELHAFALRHLPEVQSYSLRGFTVHDLGRPSAPLGLTRWKQERVLARALDQHGPFDLIHGFYADPAGRLAARAGRRMGIPSVVTCDSGEFVADPAIDYGSQRSRRGRDAVREACELATTVHVCTNFMRVLAEAHGVRTTVIPLTSVTSRAATIKWQERRASGSLRIIQVASLSRVKNQRLLIDALPLVRKKVDAHVDLVGEDTLTGELQAHAVKAGVADHIAFHGFLPQDRVLEMLSRADLYAQSSLHEAAGVSVLEAAAAGVPAVGTAAGHVADWSPMKALAVAKAAPESMAHAILARHGDRDRRRSMAALARTYAIAHDARWCAAQFDELYRSTALARTRSNTRAGS